MLFFRILLVGIIYPSILFANCEAGGYLIHTTATYADISDHSKTMYFWYKKENGGITFENTQSYQGEKTTDTFLRTETGALPEITFKKTSLIKASLRSKPLTIRESTRQIYGTSLHIPLLKEEQQAPLPFHGYGILTKTLALEDRYSERTFDQLELLTPLRISETSVNEQKRERLKNVIITRARNNLISATEQNKITPEFIKKISIHSKQILSGTQAVLTLHFAELHLKAADQLYRDDPYLLDQVNFLRGKTVLFPLIFIEPPESPPYFFADGSLCSGYKISGEVRRYSQIHPPASDRFALTNAYISERDPTLVMIEINNALVYLFSEGKNPKVIDYPAGC